VAAVDVFPTEQGKTRQQGQQGSLRLWDPKPARGLTQSSSAEHFIWDGLLRDHALLASMLPKGWSVVEKFVCTSIRDLMDFTVTYTGELA
jgi:hypothetical protein